MILRVLRNGGHSAINLSGQALAGFRGREKLSPTNYISLNIELFSFTDDQGIPLSFNIDMQGAG